MVEATVVLSPAFCPSWTSALDFLQKLLLVMVQMKPVFGRLSAEHSYVGLYNLRKERSFYYDIHAALKGLP